MKKLTPHPERTPILSQEQDAKTISFPWSAWFNSIRDSFNDLVQTSINGNNDPAQTIAGVNGLSVVDKKSLHTVEPSAGYGIPTIAQMTAWGAAANGVIGGSGANGLPLLRIWCPNFDNVVMIQTSVDNGATWQDTSAILYAP
jgi:hypothetical protein